MGLDGKVLRQATERLRREKTEREKAFHRRESELFLRNPRLAEIERELRSTVASVMAAALRSDGDPEEALSRVQEQNRALREERRLLLGALGEKEDALSYSPACPRCGDTGYMPSGMCDCLRRIYLEEQRKKLSRLLNVEGQSFRTFDLEKYGDAQDSRAVLSPRECAGGAKKACEEFAYSFGKKFENIMLCGEPGLGKTHLSAAVARVVTERGYSVVYDTAGHVFALFDQQKFNRESEEEREDIESVLEADLLILDDLGTEVNTEYARAALYQIVNTRLMERRCTLINTNLSPAKLKDRYGAAIASRLTGEYTVYPLYGNDLRQKK